jgi:hypothetical protein
MISKFASTLLRRRPSSIDVVHVGEIHEGYSGPSFGGAAGRCDHDSKSPENWERQWRVSCRRPSISRHQWVWQNPVSCQFQIERLEQVSG